MKCPDCKGGGKYVGAGTIKPEECQRCEGIGELNNDGTVIGSKKRALDSVFNSNLPDWMEDYQDQIGMADAPFNFPRFTDEQIKQVKKLLRGSPPNFLACDSELKVGNILYIYDAGWHEATVIYIDIDGSIIAETACDTFCLGPHASYNLTQKRWEYIRSGTPVWP